jgi:hypothetical protein
VDGWESCECLVLSVELDLVWEELKIQNFYNGQKSADSANFYLFATAGGGDAGA